MNHTRVIVEVDVVSTARYRGAKSIQASLVLALEDAQAIDGGHSHVATLWLQENATFLAARPGRSRR